MHLVLLPGLLCDASYWEAQAVALWDVAVPRVAVFGMLDDIGTMARSVLDTAPDRFALAGHSMGGRVAQEIYRLAPERVTRLALFCTDYRAPADADERRRELLERRAMLAEARGAGMDAFARGWAKRNIAPQRVRDAKLVAAIVRMVCRQSLDVLAAQTLAGLNRGDYSELLPRIACPALVCTGELDALRDVEIHRDMAQRIAGSELVVIPRAGHMVAMEEPEAVTAVLRRFLA